MDSGFLFWCTLMLCLFILCFNPNSQAETINLKSEFARTLLPNGVEITINSYTLWEGNQSIGTKDILTVNDTLIITGDLSFGADAIFNLNDGAVCIIYGDLELNNKVNLSIGAHLIVGGSLTATSNAQKIDVQIDSTAAVYILGDVDSTAISGITCPTPEEYVPHTTSTECNFGDIISLEDNENDSTGIYDFFVSGDIDKGLTPVYSDLCSGDSVVLSALHADAYLYQWCDSLGIVLSETTSNQFVVTEPGEYFVNIFETASTSVPDTSHRAKVVGELVEVSVSVINSIICSGDNAEFLLSGTVDATVTYNINGGTDSLITLTGGTVTVTLYGVAEDQTLNLVSISNGACSNGLNVSTGVTVADFNITVTDASTHASNDCPEFGSPFNPNSASYNPGTTELVFQVTRSSGAGNWSFDFALTGASAGVDDLTIAGGTNAGTNTAGTISAGASTEVTFTFRINNDPGNQLDLQFEVSNGAAGSCSEANTSDNTITHTIAVMPDVGSFN
ncbi:hypothetical protein OU798_10560 [Prolixibacteraceae bacterium Z1-6]|uniref:Uncharacterized protein n=1 Tax=Draconibacterium aestuarii TaxID=2998507 RepID=A0A9X3FDS4_9BACT|nr:hypothetical protein [Prolixibacteraceae bacterium Z1-6]